MKQNIPFLRLLSLALLLSFTACTKDHSTDETKDNSEISVHSDDELFITSEIDWVFTEVSQMMDLGSNISPRQQDNMICDATVALDLISNPRTVTITYNGGNCLPNRSREGVIVLSVAQGMELQNAGAVFKVSFKDFKITRKSDKKSITVNGEQTYTNVSGGSLIGLSSQDGDVVHTVVSNGLSLTFKDGSKRTWQVAQKRIYTYNNGIVATVLGMRTENNDSKVAVWGTNRFGTAFTSSITDPLVIRQDCSFRLTSGTIKHTVGAVTATATFGLDASGSPVSCPAGNYFYKLEWTGPNGNSLSAILAY